jgi:hypothetical protein
MAYRDDDRALEAKREAIVRELDGASERARQLAGARAEQSRLRAELADLDRRRRQAAVRMLPMLARARIASPCSADWNAMEGDDRVRFCERCQKHVYDLSALSTAEAEALLREKEGDLCARLARREDGTVVTGDCPVGASRRRGRTWGLLVGGIAVATAAAALAQQSQPAPTSAAPMVMGSVAIAPASPPPVDAPPSDSSSPPPPPRTRPSP